jgi:hypothetical protein
MVPILRDVLAQRKNRVIPELAQPAIAKDVEAVDVIVSAETVEVKATLFLDWVAVYEKGATRRRFVAASSGTRCSCAVWKAAPPGATRWAAAEKPDASFSGGRSLFLQRERGLDRVKSQTQVKERACLERTRTRPLEALYPSVKV